MILVYDDEHVDDAGYDSYEYAASFIPSKSTVLWTSEVLT